MELARRCATGREMARGMKGLIFGIGNRSSGFLFALFSRAGRDGMMVSRYPSLRGVWE